MPTLDWIGKKAVLNHHREVPYRLLQCDSSLSIGNSDAGNLLVHGDNLAALKALLPYYAGKVKCIYIDPPYNTGNKDWSYNDNVSGPEIHEWLNKTVGGEGEDLTRHDKWLCMMYPRLSLLKEFLSIDGIIAVSIDDNELNNMGILLDEIFGPKNRLACAPWLAEPSGGKEKTGLRGGHEYIFLYHNGDDSNISREIRSSGDLNLKDKWGKYRKGRELRKWGGTSRRSDRPGQWFPLSAPDGTEVWPIRNDGQEGHWRWGKEQLMKPILEDTERAHWELRPFDDGVTWQGKRERWVPYEKIRDPKKSIGWSTWLDSYGFNADATRELKEIFGQKIFDTPKPSALIRWIVSLHADDDAIVLDSFAGSGTTGHAVLQLNNEDGGNRKFILVEMEENICRNVTAVRLERVIKGYGKQNGLGSGFKFCTLAEPLFDEKGHIHKKVTFPALAAHVFFTETGQPIPKRVMGKTPLLGVYNGTAVYLLFNGILGDKQPSGGNVLTNEILLNLPAYDGAKVIYGAACRLSPQRLKRENINFRQTPYEIRTR
jgi:adenine-specific DNA-methyltransferase